MIGDIAYPIVKNMQDTGSSTPEERRQSAGEGGSGGYGEVAKGMTDDVTGYWGNYASQAIPVYQGLGNQAQVDQNAYAQQSQQAGNNYGAILGGTGQAVGDQLTQQGLNYSNQLSQMGQGYSGQLQGIGTNALNSGLQGANRVDWTGQQQGQALTNQANMMNQAAAAAQGRAGPALDFNRQNAALDMAGAYAGSLAGVESNQGPSAAQAQLQNATNQSQMNNLAMARSGRGFGGSASAMRAAAEQNAAAGQQAGNQSAILRAQEDAAFRQRQAANLGAAAGLQQAGAGQFGQQQGMQAQTQLQQQQQNDQLMSSLYGQSAGLMGQGGQLALQGAQGGAQLGQAAYGQQLGAYGQAAQVGLGAEQAAAQTAIGATEAGGNMMLQGYGAGANTTLAGLGQAGTQSNQGFQSAMAGQQQAGQVYGALQQSREQAVQNYLQGGAIDQETSIANAQSNNQLLGAAVAAGGMALAASDERAKTDIGEATLDLLDKAPGFTYRYKDPATHGEGKFLGPMAQDLEKSEIGRSMVINDSTGVKKVDTGRAGLAALGGLSVLKRDFESKIDKLRAEIDGLGKRKSRKAA